MGSNVRENAKEIAYPRRDAWRKNSVSQAFQRPPLKIRDFQVPITYAHDRFCLSSRRIKEIYCIGACTSRTMDERFREPLHSRCYWIFGSR